MHIKKLEKYIQVVCKLFRFKKDTKLEIENIRDSSQVLLTRKYRLFSHMNQSSGFAASKFEHTFLYNLQRRTISKALCFQNKKIKHRFFIVIHVNLVTDVDVKVACISHVNFQLSFDCKQHTRMSVKKETKRILHAKRI